MAEHRCARAVGINDFLKVCTRFVQAPEVKAHAFHI